MNTEERNIKVQEFFGGCVELMRRKGRDYSPDDVAFKQETDIGETLGMSPEQVLYVHMKKHLAALNAYFKNGCLESDTLHSRLQDVANYAALINTCVNARATE